MAARGPTASREERLWSTWGRTTRRGPSAPSRRCRPTPTRTGHGTCSTRWRTRAVARLWRPPSTTGAGSVRSYGPAPPSRRAGWWDNDQGGGVVTDLAVDGRHIADPPRTPLGAVQIADLLGRPRPTDEQVRVIEAPLEPVLVVAGAGSGKTETMAARVGYLVANGLVAPARVLGLTFTRKAAGELSERVRRRLRALRHALRRTARYGGEGSPSMMVAPTIGTYHSYAASLV